LERPFSLSFTQWVRKRFPELGQGGLIIPILMLLGWDFISFKRGKKAFFLTIWKSNMLTLKRAILMLIIPTVPEWIPSPHYG
jgi:hypothetical protein